MRPVVQGQGLGVSGDLSDVRRHASVGSASHQVFEDVEVDEFGSRVVQAKAADLAHGLSTLGTVGVVLGTSRHEFHDVVPLALVRQVAQVIAEGRVEARGVVHVDDGVGVVLKDAGVQGFHDVVQMQTSVAGGEGGQKDVADLVEGHGLGLGSVF